MRAPLLAGSARPCSPTPADHCYCSRRITNTQPRLQQLRITNTQPCCCAQRGCSRGPAAHLVVDLASECPHGRPGATPGALRPALAAHAVSNAEHRVTVCGAQLACAGRWQQRAGAWRPAPAQSRLLRPMQQRARAGHWLRAVRARHEARLPGWCPTCAGGRWGAGAGAASTGDALLGAQGFVHDLQHRQRESLHKAPWAGASAACCMWTCVPRPWACRQQRRSVQCAQHACGISRHGG